MEWWSSVVVWTFSVLDESTHWTVRRESIATNLLKTAARNVEFPIRWMWRVKRTPKTAEEVSLMIRSRNGRRIGGQNKNLTNQNKQFNEVKLQRSF